MTMRHLKLLVAALSLLAAAPSAAQSDILMRLRSGSPAGDRFRVDSAGGVVALGSLGIGIIPASGGTSGAVRMMFHPFKGSFRVGGPGDVGAWDDANVGFYTYAGGFNTIATGVYSFSHGDGSTASGQSAAAFGEDNTAAGSRTFVAGWGNRAASIAGFAGGRNAWAGTSFRGGTNSWGGAVALGHSVTADADWAVALGFRASAAGHVGSFTFGGSLAGASAATDSIRAVADGQATWRVPGGFRIFTNTAATVGVQVNAGGSSWNVISDRNRKQDFLATDSEDILARLRQVPVSTWRYTEETDRSVTHIGPMAQDWQRAFGFSRDETTINMSDFDGVNLAAIQALDTRVQGLTASRAADAARISALEAENAELRARLERIEARLQQTAP
jgi:trimeric autotransporter adhesin